MRAWMTSTWVLLLALSAPACGPGAAVDAGGAAEGDRIERTIVTLRDGRPEVRTEVVTRAQVQAEMDARAGWGAGAEDGLGTAASAIGVDGSCAGSSLWLFDGPAGGAYSHELCLAGTGTLPMNVWQHPVVSFWPGIDPGMLSHPTASCTTVQCPAQDFPAWGPWANTWPGFSLSDLVSLYALPQFPRTWDGVHQFVVADDLMSQQQVEALVTGTGGASGIPVDFVWSADTWSVLGSWQAPAPAVPPVAGHYAPMSSLATYGYVRCVEDADCGLPGYKCQTFPQSLVSWVVGEYIDGDGNPEAVCQDQGIAQHKTCKGPTGATDCAITIAAGVTTMVPGTCTVPPGMQNGTCSLDGTQLQAIEYAYWHDKHPGWLLYTSQVDDYTHVAWVEGATPFDISNPAVANELLGRIQHWPWLSSFGALSLDTVVLANYYGAHYTCTAPNGGGACTSWSVPSVYTSGGQQLSLNGNENFNLGYCSGWGGYCDLAWTTMVTQWLGRVRDEMHKIGLNLVINIGYGYASSYMGSSYYAFIPPTDGTLQQVFGIVDGVFDERGFTNGQQRSACSWATWRYNGLANCGYGPPRSDWSDYASYMSQVQALGKPYFSKNDYPGLGNASSMSDPSIQWVLASHLMARGTSSTFAAESLFMGDDGSSSDYAYMDPSQPNTFLYQGLGPASLPIGHPCQAQQSPSPNLFTREYSGGLVVVNADSSAPYTVDLPWSSQPVTLQPENGGVYLAPSTTYYCP